MRKLQPDRELEKILVNWLQNISESSLEEYFEILENQQIQMLKQAEDSDAANAVRIGAQQLQRIYNSFLTLKRRPQSQKPMQT